MWRKSSTSNSASQCVEVRGDLTALRDSKRPHVILPVNRAALNRLTAFTHTGRITT